MKEKPSEKYLGDLIHEKGLKESVAATIKSREGRINAAILEVRSIIDDFRVQTIGGTLAGLEIWELALIPSILNNCETWVEIDQTSINILEGFQNKMFRSLLSTPQSTPMHKS